MGISNRICLNNIFLHKIPLSKVFIWRVQFILSIVYLKKVFQVSLSPSNNQDTVASKKLFFQIVKRIINNICLILPGF